MAASTSAGAASPTVFAELDALDRRTADSRDTSRTLELELQQRRLVRALSAARADLHEALEAACHWQARHGETAERVEELERALELRGGAPAAPEAVRRPVRGRVTRVAVLAAALAVAAATALLAGGGDVSSPRSRVPPAAARAATRAPQASHGIPAAWVARYQRAGQRYGLDWRMLAAVGAVESDHGRSPLPGVRDGAGARGAAGPAQFIGAAWSRFGVDADGDGVRNRHDPDDAVASMAAYLRASGAPQDWPQALHAYNHSTSYVHAVLAAAARYGAHPNTP